MIFLVPELGIEPRWACARGILSPLRLPVSPLRRAVNYIEGRVKVKKILLTFMVSCVTPTQFGT